MKKYAPFGILITLLLIVFIVGYKFYTSPVKNITVIATQDYVVLIRGGGPENPHEAIFKFTIPIESSDLIPLNILHCVLSASAGTPEESRNESCDQTLASSWSFVNETSSTNGFSIEFNQDIQVLTIRDINNSTPSGAFYIGCASCTSNIRFTNIHDKNGNLLPDIIISVY